MRHCIYTITLSMLLVAICYAEPLLENSNRQPLDVEGTSMEMHGNLILSGAPSADSAEPGRIYQFEEDALMPWSERSPINSPQPMGGGSFGHAISAWSFRAVIGAPEELVEGPLFPHRSGVAYVMEKSGDSWHVVQRLNDLSVATLYYGWAVSVHTHKIAVSSLDKVHIYRRECPCGPEGRGGRWVLDAVISAPERNTWFGGSVALSRNWLAVGAAASHAGENQSGAVYIYKKVEGSWLLHTTLRPPVATHCGHFGSSLDIKWSLPVRLVVSAPGGTGNYDCSDDSTDGQVYVFEYGSATDEWDVTFQTGMHPGFSDGGRSGDGFGKSIGASNSMLAVGSRAKRGDTKLGLAFVYRYFPDHSTWLRVAALSPDEAIGNDSFGSSIDTNGRCVAVGSRSRSGRIAAMANRNDLQGGTHVFCEIPSGYVVDEGRVDIRILCCDIPPDPVGPISYELNLKAVGVHKENVINLRTSLTYPNGKKVDIEKSELMMYPDSEQHVVVGKIELGEDAPKGAYKLSVFATSNTGRTDISHYRFLR